MPTPAITDNRMHVWADARRKATLCGGDENRFAVGRDYAAREGAKFLTPCEECFRKLRGPVRPPLVEPVTMAAG